MLGVEEEAGTQFRAVARAADMHDFGRVVKDPAKAMTTEVADNTVPEFFRMPLDRIADVAHGIPGLCLLDAQHHAFVRPEERRVGKECFRTCRFRWSPCH